LLSTQRFLYHHRAEKSNEYERSIQQQRKSCFGEEGKFQQERRSSVFLENKKLSRQIEGGGKCVVVAAGSDIPNAIVCSVIICFSNSYISKN
jgi:hypothetical protein